MCLHLGNGIDDVINQILTAEVEIDGAENLFFNQKCKNEITALQNEIKECAIAVDLTKIFFYHSLILNSKTDIEIQELKREMQKYRFDEFDLLKEMVDDLQSIENTAKKDFKFIVRWVRGVYRADLTRLKNRTFTGRKKPPLSPERVNKIQQVFKKRIKGRIDEFERRRTPQNL